MGHINGNQRCQISHEGEQAERHRDPCDELDPGRPVERRMPDQRETVYRGQARADGPEDRAARQDVGQAAVRRLLGPDPELDEIGSKQRENTATEPVQENASGMRSDSL